jgi:hypothetical protein
MLHRYALPFRNNSHTCNLHILLHLNAHCCLVFRVLLSCMLVLCILLLTLKRYVTLCLLHMTHHTLQDASGMKRAAETDEEGSPAAKQQCIEGTSSGVTN